MREPDVIGEGRGRNGEPWTAWRCKLPPVGERETRDHDATLACWIVRCPGAHLAWSYWSIGVYHLRPIPGGRPVSIVTPGAQWEMICIALDPQHEAELDPDDSKTFHFLQPIDWMVQFGDVKTDHDAVRVVGLVVDAIMSGKVSPDRDFRSVWERSIPATAKCIADGCHPEH